MFQDVLYSPSFCEHLLGLMVCATAVNWVARDGAAQSDVLTDFLSVFCHDSERSADVKPSPFHLYQPHEF
jgi:hypothetical protein